MKRERDKSKLPTVNNKVVSLPQKPANKKVSFKGPDYSGNILRRALRWLARGCTTELDKRLDQGARNTKSSLKQNKSKR